MPYPLILMHDSVKRERHTMVVSLFDLRDSLILLASGFTVG